MAMAAPVTKRVRRPMNPAAVMTLLDGGSVHKCYVKDCSASADCRSRCLLCQDLVYCARHHRTCDGCRSTYCPNCILSHKQCRRDGCMLCCESVANECEVCQATYCDQHAADGLEVCKTCKAVRCGFCVLWGYGQPDCAVCNVATFVDKSWDEWL